MLGVVLGLVLGKQIGITGVAAFSIFLGIAKKPTGVSWKLLYSISWLGGIGFTMSLFISALAFGGAPLNDAAKLGILIASLIAGVGGFFFLKRNLPRYHSKYNGEETTERTIVAG
jgi:NhaA family Na+:H+ antiporter